MDAHYTLNYSAPLRLGIYCDLSLGLISVNTGFIFNSVFRAYDSTGYY